MSAFSGPQDPNDWPGLIEVEEDDPRYAALMSPVEPDKAAMAYSTRDSLLAIAALRIALHRVEQQEGFPVSIDWPVQPA